MYSTPSRSSASRIMSAPVICFGGLLVVIWAQKMKKPPPFGRGLLRSIRRLLGRACPRGDANKAQKAEKYEAGHAGLGHVWMSMLTSGEAVRVVTGQQISGLWR